MRKWCLSHRMIQHFSFVLPVLRLVLCLFSPCIFCQRFLSDIPVFPLPSRLPLSLPPSLPPPPSLCLHLSAPSILFLCSPSPLFSAPSPLLKSLPRLPSKPPSPPPPRRRLSAPLNGFRRALPPSPFPRPPFLNLQWAFWQCERAPTRLCPLVFRPQRASADRLVGDKSSSVTLVAGEMLRFWRWASGASRRQRCHRAPFLKKIKTVPPQAQRKEARSENGSNSIRSNKHRCRVVFFL